MNIFYDYVSKQKRPDWKIILGYMDYQDPNTIYRICRKMIIYLDRRNITEIRDLIDELNPEMIKNSSGRKHGENWPKPKGTPYTASNVVRKVFEIAEKHLDEQQISDLLNDWIFKENLNHTTMVLEKRHAPLSEVVEAVKSFVKILPQKTTLTLNERIGLRVLLIQRLLSENLNYMNIAKDYITLEFMASILDRIIGSKHGNGKFGGKSAGMILAHQILDVKKKDNPLLQNIKTPKSWFLSSDGLVEFIHYNALEEFVFTKYMTPEKVAKEYPFMVYIFKSSHFSQECMTYLEKILDDLEGNPIVVRSSSLLEDSFEASFSGKYKSLFIANVGTKQERLAALMDAIAEVYASTFGPDPIEYRKVRKLIDFREEMGVLIQEVIGTKIGKYFVPSFAGVAFSNNEFRWSKRIRRSDGVVRLVAGLGTRAVDRTIDDYPVLVSPGQPGIRINTVPEDVLLYSQKYIDVINLETNSFETLEFNDFIKECNGYIPGLEKIVSFNRQGILADPVTALAEFLKEDLVITFNNLINKTDFVKQIDAMLKTLHEAFDSPVDIEFVSNGKDLYLLQCRPQSQLGESAQVSIPVNIESERRLFTATRYVNTGKLENLRYIIYVDGHAYGKLKSTKEMYDVGKIISKLNRKLPKRKFVLIGPGRWGSKGDIKLGVPVVYSDINNTAMLIEVAWEKEGYVPELSFGTHFFQDLVEADIKYLPLYPDNKSNVFNEKFFLENENALKDLLPDFDNYSHVVKVIDFESMNTSLSVFMDGESSRAVAVVY